MTYSHAEVQGQRSVGAENRVETSRWTDGRTEAIALPPTLMRSITTSTTVFYRTRVYLMFDVTEISILFKRNIIQVLRQ